MAIPGFTAGLSLERSTTIHYVVNEYESTNDKMLLAQGRSLPCWPSCNRECWKSPFNDGKCYRWCVNGDCSYYYMECEPSEPCVPCCPPSGPGCVTCPPPPPPCTPGCGPCINGVRHCYTEQCLGYIMACDVQPRPPL
jgi:hypothetical protein